MCTRKSWTLRTPEYLSPIPLAVNIVALRSQLVDGENILSCRRYREETVWGKLSMSSYHEADVASRVSMVRACSVVQEDGPVDESTDGVDSSMS